MRLPHTCAPERYAKHYLPHREVRIPAERFCVIGTEFPITSKSAPQCGALSSAQLKWVKIHCAADCGRETTASWYIKLGKGINLNYLK